MIENNRILITGGAGLVGQNLTTKLVELGYQNISVHCHVRQPRIKYDSVTYLTGDLTTYSACLDITKNIDCVIHAAASTSNAVDTVNDPLAHVTPNVAMNNFIIDSSYRNKVKKYIFISSNTVYPPTVDDVPVVETDFLFDKPYDVYFPVGWMKRYAEIQCELYAKYLSESMLTIVVRPANLYGPHDKYDFKKCHVTAATIRKVADNMNPIPVWGDGSELRDLLYIDDFVDALCTIIDKQESYDVFNVGSNQVYSVIDVLETMQSLVNNTNPVAYISGKPSMISIRRIDSNKITSELGWKATTSLSDGLKKSYDWYLNNKDEFE